MRRVGTSTPYRNKDGSIDRRRIREAGFGGGKGHFDEEVEDLNPEDFPPEYRNKDGSLDRRRVRPHNIRRGHGQDFGSGRLSVGSQGGGRRRGYDFDEEVSDLDPEDFPPEYRNKDGSLDRRRVRPRNIRRGGHEDISHGRQSYGGSYERRGGGGGRGSEEYDIDELMRRAEREENLGEEFRNSDGSLDKRRVVPYML